MITARSLLFFAIFIAVFSACGGQRDSGSDSPTPSARLSSAPPERAVGIVSLLPPPTPEGLERPADKAVVGSPPTEPVDDKFRDAVAKYQQTGFLTGRWECIGGLVEESGPAQVMQAAVELIASGDIHGAIDTHNFAHNVGGQTARVLGLNGEAFLRCSIDFNYGCQHGFFEHALATSPNATEAATSICADLVGVHPAKTVFYCYHGVGHGVMMASSYDLALALETCDALGDAMASDGCWQGVFMENVNAVMRGESREGVFSDTDPLAPCNRVAERHQWECYINHAGRLITLFDFSVAEASHACLNASPAYILACVQSLGLMVSNPAWQLTLVGPRSQSHNVEVTLELCAQFPTDYLAECIVGAVDNIMNFDGVVLDRALRLCQAAEEPHQRACYYRIGLSIGVQLTDLRQRYGLCQQLNEPYRDECLNGAGVGIVDGQLVARDAAPPEGTAAQPAPAPPGPVAAQQGASLRASGSKCKPADDTVVARVEVRVVDGAFQPERVTVNVGEAVRWINDGSEFIWPASDDHPTHEKYVCFNARKPIVQGGSWAFTFDHPGVWGYHDHLSPKAEGVVVVE